MKTIFQSIRGRLGRAVHSLITNSAPASFLAPLRSGWPPLSLTPAGRRRATGAGRWHPRGPRNDW
jgi:hypothetical protein